MTLRRRGYVVEAKKKKVTYLLAMDTLLDYLEKDGWKVKQALKIPHATKGDVKLWFKKQAVYASHSGHAFGNARSLHIDPRKLIDDRFSPEKVAGFLYRKGKALADVLSRDY